MPLRISVLWKQPPGEGSVALTNAGMIDGLEAGGRALSGCPAFTLHDAARLDVEISGARMDPGPFATVVHIRTRKDPFSFFLRDVSAAHPIFIPEYGVIVTDAECGRDYQEIAAQIMRSGMQSKLQAIESQPEESFEGAAKQTRDLKCVTWLGLARDIRNFEINFHAMTAADDVWDTVLPKRHGFDHTLDVIGGNPARYRYFCGRGFSSVLDRTRWLEDGVLPVLNACLIDEEIHYHYKIFATLEKSSLIPENVQGTHYLVADRYSYGSMQTPEQKQRSDLLHDSEVFREEETVCFVRVRAVNTGRAPRYSFVRIPQPESLPEGMNASAIYDNATGFGAYGPGKVYLIASLNGKPVPDTEMSVLLAPGETAEYVFRIPHSPIPEHRAAALAVAPFQEKFEECAGYWRKKLAQAAPVRLPEERIDRMIKAGVLHLDLVAYGREPGGALAATIGVYSPIGSESAPIIQFLDSMGLHGLARRAIQYFIDKQHEDGFMQNFGGYMLETGCVLWTIGEHWRYTRDDAWIRSIRGSILKAVDYIAAWRNRSKREELRGCGYGMIDGKVCDFNDRYHIFMLNGTACVGMKRAAEALAASGDVSAASVAQEAEDFRKDIIASLDAAFAAAPAVPLANGAWCPSMPVWAETPGSICLQVSGGNWFSHGTMMARDTLVSTQYLLLDELIPPDHVYAGFILNCLADNFFNRNTCFSQPYYSPHPWANLMRGEVKAFLKEFYTNVSSLADRETHTFWEHLYYASPHKTHEEAWFLMRCRWMLYLEKGDTLAVLPGIPRTWLEDGKVIEVTGAACYFGKLSFKVESKVSAGRIDVCVKVEGASDRLPANLAVRVPHPHGMRASSVSEGSYDAQRETVTISVCGEETSFTVTF